MRFNVSKALKFAAVMVLVAAACSGVRGWGQAVTTGTLDGDVTDTVGAVLPGARITVTNQATGAVRQLVSDSAGHFVASQLAADQYDVSVLATGFKESVVHNVKVTVDATASVAVRLDVGTTTQKVEVNAAAVQAGFDPSKTDVSSVIQETQLRELPINQRSFTALVTQQPGLVNMTNATNNTNESPTSLAFSTGSQISSNGLNSLSMAYLVDGVALNSAGYGAPGTAAGGDIPGVEGIQEFKVLTMDYSAAYGGAAGAVVSFATRGGSNNWHGSAYEFLRNNALDAREYFNNLGPQNPYRRSQFGGTIGGPIKRDKTFFFVNYEALRSRLTTTQIADVPTVAARNGGLDGTSGYPVLDTWFNPTSISAGTKALLALYPLPNGIDYGNGVAQSSFANYQPVNQQYGLIRFDQVLSSKDSFMARYSITDANGNSAYHVPAFTLNTLGRIQGLALKWTRVINSNLVNTLSFSFQRSYTFANDGPTGSVDADAYTGEASRALIGELSIGSSSAGGGGGAISPIGSDIVAPLRFAQNAFPLSDDLIWTHGRHTVKFGGRFSPDQSNFTQGGVAGGLYEFSDLNDFLAGGAAASLIKQDGTNPSFKYRTNEFAWYVEDTWRVKPNLTFTLGLRHDFQGPVISEAHSPSRLGTVTSTTDPIPAQGSATFPKNYTLKHFGPRIGVAYDPFNNGKTVVRSGFGLFYDTIGFAGNLVDPLSFNTPQSVVLGSIGYNALPASVRQLGEATVLYLISIGAIPDEFSTIPFPSCPGNSCTTPVGNERGAVYGVFGGLKGPTSLQYNLQVEQQLPGNFKVAGTYTGSHTYHIRVSGYGDMSVVCSYVNGRAYYGTTDKQCGSTAPAIDNYYTPLLFSVSDWEAQSFYNSGTITVARTFGSTATFSSSYSFAKGISDADTNDGGEVATGNVGQAIDLFHPKADRSESMFSIRHRFIMNGVFELPFGQGKRFANGATGIKQQLIGNWALNPLMEFRDGYPMSVLAGLDISNSGVSGTTLPDRPDMIRAKAVKGGIVHYFDPTAYQLQPAGFQGDATRNSVRGPGYSEFDLSATKHFRIRESADLEFRAEAFNLINHPNFDLPFNEVFSPEPGGNSTVCNLTTAQLATYSCNPQAGAITGIVGTPRELQLALKLTF